MGSFTQGPWKVETHNNKLEVWSDGQFIATAEHDLFFSADKHDNKKSNAVLIAAAPEMLEALELVLKSSCYEEELMTSTITRAALQAVEKIIAKAKGEQNV